VSELVSLGPIDASIEAKLQDFALALGLEKADGTAVLTGRFTTEFEPIKQRMEFSFVLTDSDLEEIETLKKKYNVNLNYPELLHFFALSISLNQSTNSRRQFQSTCF
jgi:hypothetical protein